MRGLKGQNWWSFFILNKENTKIMSTKYQLMKMKTLNNGLIANGMACQKLKKVLFWVILLM